MIYIRLMQSPQLVQLPSRSYAWLQYPSKFESHGWLMCGVLSTYAGSWEEGMSYRVRITHPNLCNSNIAENLNCIEVNSCAGCLLLYVGSREEGMLYQVQITRMSSHVRMTLYLRKCGVKGMIILQEFKEISWNILKEPKQLLKKFYVNLCR